MYFVTFSRNLTTQRESYKPYFFVTKLCNQVCNFVSTYYLGFYSLFKHRLQSYKNFVEKRGKGWKPGNRCQDTRFL